MRFGDFHSHATNMCIFIKPIFRWSPWCSRKNCNLDWAAVWLIFV